MTKTECYSYFAIGSNGEVQNGIGMVAYDRGKFDPVTISKKLDIVPFRTRKYGDLRNNGTVYQFSSWSGVKSTKGRIDVGAQCEEIVDVLITKVDILKELKKQYNLCYSLQIVPHIVVNEDPMIYFNDKVISFCSELGVSIDVDIYTYDGEDED